MLRTQISLSPVERALLDALVAETGRSMSSLIRDAINATYGPADDAAADVKALNDVFGAWGADGPGGQEYVDELRSGGRWDRIG